MSFELQGSGTYEDVVLQAKALIEDEPELVPNMANLSALLNLTLKNINWMGFYTVQPDGNLLLGPFQGKPACIRIKAGRGVCGSSAHSMNAAARGRGSCGRRLRENAAQRAFCMACRILWQRIGRATAADNSAFCSGAAAWTSGSVPAEFFQPGFCGGRGIW